MGQAGRYDVVVAGGGPAGSSAAIALARAGRRVLLLEAGPDPPFKIGEALPPAANPVLRELGVLDLVRGDGHLPCYGNLSVWGQPRVACTDFIHDLHGHGWHLDRPRFDSGLRGAAADAGAEVRRARLVGARRSEPDGWRIEVEGCEIEREIGCHWLIDATGRRAALARRHGGVRRSEDCLVSYFAYFRAQGPISVDRDSRTLIEAAPDGWWYTALVPSGRRVVAYMTDADLVTSWPARPAEGGLLTLLARTECILPTLLAGAFAPERPFRPTPAQSARTWPASGAGWLAAGDAALSLDPLSSRGLLTAMLTGLAGGRAVHDELSGDLQARLRYERHLESNYRAYLGDRAAYYALEGRWSERPFWRRRARE